MTTIPPGGIIGILGDGQLGRMMALAAAEMGYKTHIFGQENDSPAAQVAHHATIAGYDDLAALDAFAAAVDVVTLEFENIPTATLAYLEEKLPVRPGKAILEITQDRLLEKSFIREQGIGTAPFADVMSQDDLTKALNALGTPAVLKTKRLGYDGKGQVKIDATDQAAQAWQAVAEAPSILEGFVPFDKEISVLVARDITGNIEPYIPVENRHKNHILDITLAPADISAATTDKALDIAHILAEKLDLIGLLAIEMFVLDNGDVLVNELAPRPHNSGHWTMEACNCSQFHQIIRAVAGLPLGSAMRHSNAVMTNLIGEDANDWANILNDPKQNLHLYGKASVRAGRKMGHVTKLFPLDTPPKA